MGEIKVSKDMVRNATENQASKIKQLEIDHFEITKEEKAIEMRYEMIKGLEQKLITLPPEQKIMKEQEVAKQKLEIQKLKTDLDKRKNELNKIASSVIKSVEALGAGQLMRQKHGILSTFLRSLDSERHLLENREEELKGKLFHLSHRDSS